MVGRDLQLGGGYAYQWETAILLALNYFYDPLAYSRTLFERVTTFIGSVQSIRLEGRDSQTGRELEDVALIGADRRLLIQVKTKDRSGALWAPSSPALNKSLFRFYESGFLADDPDNTRFIFLSNRGFNKDLHDFQHSTSCDHAPIVERLVESVQKWAADNGKNGRLERGRFNAMLQRTDLVKFLPIGAITANIEAKLQAHGRTDWRETYSVLFEHFASQSMQRGGGNVDARSMAQQFRLSRRVTVDLEGDFDSFTGEARSTAIAVLESLFGVRPGGVKIRRMESGSVVLVLDVPADGSARMKELIASDRQPMLDLLRAKRITVSFGKDEQRTWRGESEGRHQWHPWTLADADASARRLLLRYAHELSQSCTRIQQLTHALSGTADRQTDVAAKTKSIQTEVAEIRGWAQALAAYSDPKLPILAGHGRVALDMLARETLLLFSNRARQRGIEIVLHGETRRAEVDAEVRIALMNLVDNAVKYSDGGRVGIQLKRGPRRVYVRVTNPGSIQIEDRERIFDAGYRGKQAPATAVGIGLHVARQIARQQGGELSVEVSATPPTITFALELPIAEATRVSVATDRDVTSSEVERRQANELSATVGEHLRRIRDRMSYTAAEAASQEHKHELVVAAERIERILSESSHVSPKEKNREAQKVVERLFAWHMRSGLASAYEGVGPVMRQIRYARGFRQSELVANLGVCVGYLSKVEGGAQRPSDGFVDKFARLVHVPTPIILALVGKPKGKLPESAAYGELQKEVLRWITNSIRKSVWPHD